MAWWHSLRSSDLLFKCSSGFDKSMYSISHKQQCLLCRGIFSRYFGMAGLCQNRPSLVFHLKHFSSITCNSKVLCPFCKFGVTSRKSASLRFVWMSMLKLFFLKILNIVFLYLFIYWPLRFLKTINPTSRYNVKLVLMKYTF